MADDVVAVNLVAKVDQLEAGFAEAKRATQDVVDVLIAGFKLMSSNAQTATDSVAKDVHSMAESVKAEEGLLHEVLSGALFLEWAEFGKMAAETVKGAFEATVGKAEEFGLANAKFAATMGTSETEAAGLSAALHGVGSSLEEYESIVLRLEQKVRANAAAMAEMGVKTTDANGAVLAGKDLMDSAITALEQYAPGADQAAAAQFLFGRKVEDVTNIARVHQEAVQRQIDIYAAAGVSMKGAGASSAQLEEAVNDLNTAWDAQKIKLGQELMPVVQAALQWMSGEGAGLLQAAGVAVKSLLTAWEATKVGIVAAVAAIAGSITAAVDTIKTFGHVVGDALTGNWGAISKDWKSGTAEIKNDFTAAMKTIEDESAAGAKAVSALWAAPKAAAGPNPFALPSGDKKFHDPKDKAGGADKGGADKGESEEIAAEEKVGLASVAIAEKTSQHLLAMGQESVDEFIAQQQHLEDLKFKIQQEALDKELAVAGQTQLGKEKILDKMQELELSHEGKLLAIAQDAEKRKQQIAQQGEANYLKDSDERLSIGLARIEKEFQGVQFGAEEKYRAEVALTGQIKGEELARLDAELGTLQKGSTEWERVYKEREKVVKTWVATVEKDQTKLWADTEKQVSQVGGIISSSFNAAINKMIFSGESLEAAMKEIGQSILQGFLSMLEQIAEKWLETQITNALVDKTITGAQNTAKVTSLSAVAAAGGFASAMAGLPYPANLIAAPATAAGAEAAVMAFAPIAAAAGGMVLDRDQLVFAHAKEMILPAQISQGMQGLIAGGGGKGAGDSGQTHFHYSPSITQNQERTLGQMLRSNGRDMLGWLNDMQRSGALR